MLIQVGYSLADSLHMIYHGLLNVYHIPRESKTHEEFANEFITTVGSEPVPQLSSDLQWTFHKRY